ncbi:MAG: DUF4249 domain-containing protein [Bacteroidetes bacterium]|nr:DUF4249 domain-containing protein [Bacteroidota bacterium]
MKRFFFVFIITSFAFAGCEKAVTFHLNNSAPKLVVEATIENGQQPMVYLSKSMDYFSSIDVAQLSANFVHNADVYISNGIVTHKLKEFTIPISGGYNFYYYSNDPANPTTSFNGELNKNYSIRIVSEGKEYTAATKIPLITKRIDSLYWIQAPAGNSVNKASLMVKVYDPPGFGDYVRYFTKRNSEPFYPGINSVYDDQVIDGTSYELQVDRGVDRNKPHSGGHIYFNKGDTVTLKLANIDKATFDFWRTMEYTYQSIGNPFATPTKVLSNMSGGALGYFGGYAAQYRTIIIPR